MKINNTTVIGKMLAGLLTDSLGKDIFWYCQGGYIEKRSDGFLGSSDVQVGSIYQNDEGNIVVNAYTDKYNSKFETAIKHLEKICKVNNIELDLG
jgi:hypothetical protein